MTHITKTLSRMALWLLCILCPTLTSCIDEKEMPDTREGNVEALWKVMDEHYCFFDEKKAQLGVDWDEVHGRYLRLMTEGMSEQQLFEHCAKMLAELKDGHVNLYSAWDTGRNWSWKEDYPTNFSENIQQGYLGTDYRMTCGIKYRILPDNIGYIYCGSFDISVGDGNLDNILYYLASCNGLIVDIRNNGGGDLTMAEKLARRFTNVKTLVGYIQHKTGKGHNDFSAMEAQYIDPANGIRWQKKVVVLTNRGVFSAANEFTKYMKAMGHIIVGDNTGGGAGLPFTSELPNGWAVRFSACPMFDAKGKSTEAGIEADIRIDQKAEDTHRNVDTILEYARSLF